MRNGTYRIAARANRERLARGLGWFSVGLGIAQILAPRRVARAAGMADTPILMRLLGMRELFTGIGILSQPQADLWLRARVAGDALDLTLLAASWLSKNPGKGRMATAGLAVAGVTALDVLCAQETSAGPGRRSNDLGITRAAATARRSIIINRSPEELYRFWHNLESLPRFMTHLISVQVTGPRHSHWIASGPAGSRVEWDAEIIEDRPNELISWRSLENSDVDNSGSVQFQRAPGGRGTLVRAEIQYRPPAGMVGARIAKLLGKAPEKQIAIDLFRLKQFIETGEIARTEGQPTGRNRSTSRKYDDLVRV
jgi:uncharacterized membrane protein